MRLTWEKKSLVNIFLGQRNKTTRLDGRVISEEIGDFRDFLTYENKEDEL